MRRGSLSCFFLVILSLTLVAQSQYVEEFPDDILLRTAIRNRTLNLNISPRVNGLTQFRQRLWYRPSVKNTLLLGVRFKGVGISYGFKLAQHPLLKNRTDDSEYFDLRVNSFGRKVGYDINYQDYKGYFISNLDISSLKKLVNSTSNILSGDTVVQRDDLQLQNFSANVYYVFNPDRFSYRSAFVMDERQVKSAGSFLITASLSGLRISADSSFVPPDSDLGFNANSYFTDSEFYTFSVTPSYAYNLVNKKGYYATLGISSLIGIMYFEGETSQSSTGGVNYFLKGIIKSSVGVHKKKWVLGVSFLADIQGLNTKYVQYRTSIIDASVFFAYRIKTNWMKGKKSFFKKNDQPAQQFDGSITP